MKALTICQPFAALICLPDDDHRAKRVENRKWGTQYRGPLLIHAGKSREWLELDDAGTCDELYELPLADMVFGAIVGVANLADCVALDMYASGIKRVPDSSFRRWPWLSSHEHTEGPFCFVLTEVRRFETPIPYRGAQGFFDVPREVVANALAAEGRAG